MMNIFLVHGSFGKPFENWFPWLEEKASEMDIPCCIPTFPTPNHQNYADWEELMNYYCRIGYVNGETILIGHSCGSAFLMKYLRLHNMHVKGLITVSGYNNYISGYEMMDELNRSFYIDEPLGSMTPYADNVYALYGDDDPNVPQDFLSYFANSITDNVVCEKNAGHFNAAAGYTKCQLVLDIIKKIV